MDKHIPTTDAQISQLWGIFVGIQQYQSIAAAPPVRTTSAIVLPSPVSLEKIFGFNGFKKLTPTLELQLDRQVTIIFGKNGSGKSSLCQALKVLSNSEVPSTPLHNVRVTPPRPTPSFSYRTQGTQTDITWTPTLGYGVERNLIKYFDSTVTLRHTTGSIETGAAVEVVAFRLEIFGYARALIQAFQRYANSRITNEKQLIETEISQVKTLLSPSVDINQEPFSNWSSINSQPLTTFLSGLGEFTSAMIVDLSEQRAKLAQLEVALTEEGLRSMKAEEVLLAQLEVKIQGLKNTIDACAIQKIELSRTLLAEKRAAQKELSRHFFPENIDATQQRALVVASAMLLDLSTVNVATSKCPLCSQALDARAVAIFHNYHSYLNSTLQQEAAVIEEELTKNSNNLATVRNFVLGDYSACQSHFPPNFINALNELIELLIQVTPTTGVPATQDTINTYSRIIEFDQYLEVIRKVHSTVSGAIHLAQVGRQSLIDNITCTKQQIAQLSAHEGVWTQKLRLQDICTRSLEQSRSWRSIENYNFTGLFNSLTRKSRDAHTELVRDAFEQRLSAEYQLLCGASIQQMGVSLKSVGDQQEIIVSPLVGGEQVHRIFSEGEQKVHALAVFFCEAVLVPHQVLVFDDPVTSFDFNNVSNFAERLRNLTRAQPNTQIIVLTHNWDFFINLQSTMNRSALGARISVQVLEDCSTVNEYSEQWDLLCTSIDLILNQQTEPTPEEKEKVSGLMRRLIERLNNLYVFNEQRHQYKPKTLQISDFHRFVKIVPLLVSEADDLRDLYANLSPLEHDDVRNFYQSKTRNQFNTWYASIKTIGAAVLARRPP